MPSKIWLHKDTKYSTGDIVCGYQYDFVQGIEDEGGIENFVEYVPADAFIEKVSEWLKECATFTDMNGKKRIDKELYKATIEDFKNFMKGE